MATSKDNDGSESVDELNLQQCGIGAGTAVDKKRPTFGFEERTSKTDLVLTLEERPLYVNRIVLEMVSPVFEKMFSQNLRESEEKKISIEGKDYHDFAEFLACFYPGKMHKISIDNVYRILPLAFEFEIDYAKNTCEAVLVESLTSMGETGLFHCMDVAYHYRIDTLKKLCLKLAVKLFTQNTHRADEIAGLRNAWKVDIYDALTPTLRSDACKYKFSCVAQNIDGIQFEEFGNAKYVSKDSSLVMSYFPINQPKQFTFSIPALWLDLSFKITIKVVNNSRTFDVQDIFEFYLSYRTNPSKVTSRAAVVLEFLNIVPGKRNLYIGKNLFVSSKETEIGSVRKTQIGSEKGEFILNGKTNIRTHLLVNEPKFIDQ